MRQKNSSTNWNFAAFFLASYWLFYRKMYGWGFLTLLTAFFYPIQLATCILFGIFGNSLYKKHIENDVLKWQSLNEPEKSRYFNRHKGTSVIAVVLLIIYYILLVICKVYLRTRAASIYY